MPSQWPRQVDPRRQSIRFRAQRPPIIGMDEEGRDGIRRGREDEMKTA